MCPHFHDILILLLLICIVVIITLFNYRAIGKLHEKEHVKSNT